MNKYFPRANKSDKNYTVSNKKAIDKSGRRTTSSVRTLSRGGGYIMRSRPGIQKRFSVCTQKNSRRLKVGIIWKYIRFVVVFFVHLSWTISVACTLGECRRTVNFVKFQFFHFLASVFKNVFPFRNELNFFFFFLFSKWITK